MEIYSCSQYLRTELEEEIMYWGFWMKCSSRNKRSERSDRRSVGITYIGINFVQTYGRIDKVRGYLADLKSLMSCFENQTIGALVH